MKMNRYIKAMEIGLANEKEGISYFELIEKLQKDLGYTFNRSAETTFMSWFDDNFEPNNNPYRNDHSFTVGQSYYFKKKYTGKMADYQIKNHEFFISIRSKKSFLKGNAAKQYLDYLELAHATEQAKKASLYSRVSIFIAIAAIGIGIYQASESPQPPFEVKIIEDNTKVIELERENDNLKEELYKAEMTLKVLEGGSK